MNLDYNSLLKEPFLGFDPLSGLDPLQMFDSFGSFKPIRDYQWKDKRYFEYARGLRIPSDIFGPIILLDYLLRGFRQRAEQIEIDLKALEKSYEDDASTHREYEEDLERNEYMILGLIYCLHSAETQLPQRPLKKIYDRIRQNPAWYLRRELTNDCVGRGGCCSRSCGCCRKRCLTSKERGTGHCTELCYCCGVNRGYSVSIAEWEIVMSNLEDRLRSKKLPIFWQ